MTSEVAILNRNAVALAADSAVTVARRKAWKTANKLFSLSPANDIGIMIYGSDDYIGHSWELIAKTFRQKIGMNTFHTVSEYAEELVKYLRSDTFAEDDLENLNVLALIDDIFDDLNDEVGEQNSKQQHDKKLAEIISDRIEYISVNFEELDCSVSKEQFRSDYSKSIAQFIEDTFKFPLSRKNKDSIDDLLYRVFCSAVKSSFSTGVVLAGYGKDQFFPELIEYQVDGKHRDFVRVWVGREENLNGKNATTSCVIPFAQSDMSQLFMEGITRNHLTFVHDTLIRVLNDKSERIIDRFIDDSDEKTTEMESQKAENEKILGEFFNEFSSYIRGEMIQPVVSVISSLPKEEMAAMAEALVEITTLRRKVDSPIETVGGPTDVVIISKGDGLVWIKRKHYFDLELNRDFLPRKRLKHGDNDAP